jgi:HSP20 family protein
MHVYYLIGTCGIIYNNMEMANMDEKKRRRFFDEFFENESFEDVTDMIENILDAIEADQGELSGKPNIYGFSITHRSGEVPVVHELGSGPNEGPDYLSEGSCMGVSESEPLVDIIETDDNVHFMAELPCVEKEDIKLSAEEMTLHISASRGDWSYIRTFDLLIPVYPESAKATFNNGVLEVIFKRRLLDGAYKIDIE